MSWFDSHCHLPPDEAAQVIQAAQEAAVAGFVNVGTDAEQSRAAVEVAQANDGVWATVGLHPHDAVQGLDPISALLHSRPPKVVAVGECGLDYHYDHSPRPVQREIFAQQVALAHQYGLALVVHSREAWDDTFEVLHAEGVPDRTVLHCFTGGPTEARRALDLGAYLSFSGMITFKGADEVRAAAELCPLERLLVETDSPYLTPVPHRGKPNQPAFVPLVGGAVATVKGKDVSEVEGSSWSAATSVFGLRPSPPSS